MLKKVVDLNLEIAAQRIQAKGFLPNQWPYFPGLCKTDRLDKGNKEENKPPPYLARDRPEGSF